VRAAESPASRTEPYEYAIQVTLRTPAQDEQEEVSAVGAN
jgi:hypothetical protein